MHTLSVRADTPSPSRPDVHPKPPPGKAGRFPPHLGLVGLVEMLTHVSATPERVEEMRGDGRNLAAPSEGREILDAAKSDRNVISRGLEHGRRPPETDSKTPSTRGLA
jgi:hypothetical protein